MWSESAEAPKKLRKGLTTGSCATACALAAGRALFANKQTEQVEISLPERGRRAGQLVKLNIIDYQPLDKGYKASTIKDAGDDPDATHGAKISVELYLTEKPGIEFKAGEGVGVVTRKGLVLEVGESAINPVPRQMITKHLNNLSYLYDYKGGFAVVVSIEKGAEIALKTMNPRLGILGGLSILGTTGIVRPYSCSAYIASIIQAVDVAHANQVEHIAASTGSTSETAIQAQYNLEHMALIEMGDFIGVLLKHLKHKPIARFSICAGFGKLTKLARGCMDLNSRASSIDFQHLADVSLSLGASKELAASILDCTTSIQALGYCQQAGIELADEICKLAWQQASAVLPAEITLEIWAVDRQGNILANQGVAA